MPESPSTVYVIDNDDSVRRALGRVIKAAGLNPQEFASAKEFIAGAQLRGDGCIISDVNMPGMSGLDLKKQLNAMDCDLPIFFLTTHDTHEIRVAARRAGASGLFRKPIDSQALIDAIRWTMETPRPIHPSEPHETQAG